MHFFYRFNHFGVHLPVCRIYCLVELSRTCTRVGTKTSGISGISQVLHRPCVGATTRSLRFSVCMSQTEVRTYEAFVHDTQRKLNFFRKSPVVVFDILHGKRSNLFAVVCFFISAFFWFVRLLHVCNNTIRLTVFCQQVCDVIVLAKVYDLYCDVTRDYFLR